MVTTDPMNYVLESIRTHLNTNVTDPVSSRDSTRPFVFIGYVKSAPQYPRIQISHVGDVTEEEAAAGRALDSTYTGLWQVHTIRVLVATKEGLILGSKSNDHLVRNLASQVTNAMTKQESDLRSYDIIAATLVGGGQVLGPDDNEHDEIRIPLSFNVEFLYKYT